MTMTYERKLNRVISVMSEQDKFKDLNWKPLKGKTKGASASMGGPGDAKDIMGLPAAPNFLMAEFEAFSAELESLEKSRARPKDTKFDGGPFPARPKFHASSYTMIDPPWNESFLSSPMQMVGTPLMPLDKDKSVNVQSYSVATDRFHGWEAGNREALSMLTYTDWFVSTVRAMLKEMADKLARNDVSVATLDSLVVDALEGVQLLESAGRGVKDIAQGVVHRLCAQTLTRRDTWIKRMTPDCPREEKIQMRLSDMNVPQLVSQDLMDRAQEALRRNKDDQVQSTILRVHAENRSNRDDGRRQDRSSKKGSQGRRKISYPSEDRNQGRWQSDRDGSFRGRGKDYRRKPPKGSNRGGGSGRGRYGNGGNNNNNNRRNENSGYTYY